MLIRASVGTLAQLGMAYLKMLEVPKTVYLLQYSPSGCLASCSFCSQSKDSSSSKDMLSRIKWPAVELKAIIESVLQNEKKFSRLCIQSIIKENFEEELLYIVSRMRKAGISLPISISISPVSRDFLKRAKRAGVDFIGVGLDAASRRILAKIKKPYTWEEYWNFIEDSIHVFGKRKVNVHLIFGLGETEKEFAEAMQRVYDAGAEASLFAFTPLAGTSAEKNGRPDIIRYRIVQILRWLLSKGYKLSDVACFEKGKVVLKKGSWLEGLRYSFLTSGCPGCNRPFYNESPALIYNYPSSSLIERDINAIKRQLSMAGLNPEVI